MQQVNTELNRGYSEDNQRVYEQVKFISMSDKTQEDII